MKNYTRAERIDYRSRAAVLLTVADDAERHDQQSAARVARRTARRYLNRAETRGWFRRPVTA